MNRGGLDPSGISASNRRIADIQERGAADYQKAAQANMQAANRNYVDEANKLAAGQAAQKNAQKVRNMGNASAGAAALARGTEEADYNAQQQRSDQQREQGVRNKDYENRMRQNAEASRAAAKQRDYTARDRANRNALSDYVSMGPPNDGDESPSDDEVESPDSGEPSPNEEQAQEAGQEAEQEAGQEAEQDSRPIPWQHFYNWVAGSQNKAVGDNDTGAGDVGSYVWQRALEMAGLEGQYSPDDFKKWALTPDEIDAAYQEGVSEGLRDPNVKLWPAYLDKLTANGQNQLRSAAERLSAIANEGRGGPAGGNKVAENESQHSSRNSGTDEFSVHVSGNGYVSDARMKRAMRLPLWTRGANGEYVPVGADM